MTLSHVVASRCAYVRDRHRSARSDLRVTTPRFEQIAAPRGMTTAQTLARVPLRGRPLVTLTGGILGLLVAMGVGRFAFTLLLPLMQSEAGFSPRVAGWLASANYFGYFVGSLTATLWPAGRGTRGALLGAFVVSTVTTIAMGLTQSIRPVDGAAFSVGRGERMGLRLRFHARAHASA